MYACQKQEEGSNFNLEETRKQVTDVTNQIVSLFCDRQKLMRDIANSKNGNGQSHLPIYLPQREQELLSHFRQIAKEKKVDPNMMDMLLSMLMSAAKFAQMGILQRSTILDTSHLSMENLKKNLLSLTAQVATTYDLHNEQAKGTYMECVREQEILKKLTEIHQGGTAINLGCANGDYVTEVIEKGFKRIIGYDLSPDMIAVARVKYPKHEFCIHDLDNGIPLDDSSADLVVANFGAASEVCSCLWKETARVLHLGGHAYFSFYNRDALVTKWWTPWSNSFRITINPYNNTIMVPCVGKDGATKVFWIHAHSATEKDVHINAKKSRLEVRRIESSSPLWDDKPPKFYEQGEAVKAVRCYEAAHAHIPPFMGQYLRVVVKKK
ncbi:MAG: chorismate mutase [Candidatus Pacebacteria bacterium]|nr:chorismate mutase [Candidatus Paceibacterota bacterium]